MVLKEVEGEEEESIQDWADEDWNRIVRGLMNAGFHLASEAVTQAFASLA